MKRKRDTHEREREASRGLAKVERGEERGKRVKRKERDRTG